jgi:flagellar hook-associated protein 3 FlgL
VKVHSEGRTSKFLADLDRLDMRQARAQREMTSGYRVILPSDGPQDMVDIHQLRSNNTRAASISQALVRVQSEVNTAESAIQVATQLVERARTIAAQNATQTAQNRIGAATEVREIHLQLVDLTKTVSSGRFIFSGDSADAPVYSSDWTKPGGIVRIAQPTNTREVQDINGTTFSVSLTAGQIFDTRDGSDNPDATNVYNAVYKLGRALEDDDRAGVEAAAELLNTAVEHLGRKLTFYGNAQRRVDNAIQVTNKMTLQYAKDLADLRDADLARSVVEISTVKVHREAALGAQAQRPRSTLFEYFG